MKSLRWAVSLSETLNSKNFEEIFRKTVLCLPEEDVDCQRLFKFRQDSLACLIGRVLMRKAAEECVSIPWEKVEFERTTKGKPFLKIEGKRDGDEFWFNVSHQGDLVVLATADRAVGVDVMKIYESRCQTAAEHICRLDRQFTDQETEMMLKMGTETDRWRAFYRVWCLKEAILKATGIGLTDYLRKYDFRVRAEQPYVPGCLLTSTKYYHENVLQTDWIIEESFIGDDHCAAVAINSKTSHESPTRFEMLKLEDLLNTANFMNISPDFCDMQELDGFLEKKNKPF